MKYAFYIRKIDSGDILEVPDDAEILATRIVNYTSGRSELEIAYRVKVEKKD